MLVIKTHLHLQVPTLYLIEGQDMPLIGKAVLNSNAMQEEVAPHQ